MMHLATQELQRHRRHKMQQLLYQAHIRFNLEPRIQNKKWSRYAIMIYLNSRQAKIDFGIVAIMEPILVRNYQIILSDDLLWHTVTKFSKPRSGQWPSPGTAALTRWAGEVVSLWAESGRSKEWFACYISCVLWHGCDHITSDNKYMTLTHIVFTTLTEYLISTNSDIV